MRHARLSLVLIALALVAAACSSEEPHALPDLNPTAAVNSPSTVVPDDLGALPTLDRCEWSETGDPILWGECRDAAVEAAQVTENPQAEPEDQFTEVLDTEDSRCLFVQHEFVSPASLSDVRTVTNALDVPVEWDSHAAVRSGGLLTYTSDEPLRIVEALLEAGIPASLRYYIVPAQRWKFGPASEALPADPGVVQRQGFWQRTGPGVVSIIDTGAAGREPPSLDSLFVGHGEFIAGIIRRLAVSVDITERSVFNGTSTLPTEGDVIEEIELALAGELAPTGRDPASSGVVNLSLGTYACDLDQIPLELAAFLGELVIAGEDVVFVAAAGNDGAAAAPFWPAGFSDPMQFGVAVDDWTERHAEVNLDEPYPDFIDALNALLDAQDVEGVPIVVGVGALVGTANGWEPAAFSNQVGAALWAPGANIVSNYPASQEPDWQGFAQWDGTSFAAPHVSALIAGCFDPRNLSRGYRDILANVLRSGGC